MENGSLPQTRRGVTPRIPAMFSYRGGQKPYLENGHSIRYSDRMSISCATAAPTRHPPGEAKPAPAAPPPPAMTIAAALTMNRAGEHVAGGVSYADAAFHFHPPRPLHAPSGSETHPTDASDQACRPTT